MAKWGIRTRLLKFMEQLEWEGINNWMDLNERLQDNAIPHFKQWLRVNKTLILSDKARELFEDYYFNENSGEVGQGYYIYLDMARHTFYAAYKKDLECREKVSKLRGGK